ncbi:LCP family protein [Hazenella sp. IB182353]|uniref:LCP family protein n=1 Tax=Polycladospora coralii TaxID=2771432 RepID=UPI0017462A02|nr:LCP family protein [Polycladospora coralii]MBS7530685.1 LCP family protein [Polycladospora coralii]
MKKVDNRRVDRVKRNRRKKWVARIGVSFLALTLLVGGYFGYQVWGAFANSQDNTFDKSKLRKEEVKVKEDPFTTLLIGTDQRDPQSNNWRADVMMLVTVNPDKQSIKIISIPRDLYVPIASTPGEDRINSAAYYGRKHGVDPVQNIRETVENYFDVPIDYYARINFKGFEDVVDALGGVEVTTPLSFRQQAIGGKTIYFKKGETYQLNGSKALAYVRMRKQDPRGDLGRNERQQEVISQLVDKLIGTKGLTNFNDLTTAVGNNLKYSFSIGEFTSLAKVYQETKANTETVQLKVYPDTTRSGAQILRLSDTEKEKVIQELKLHLELIDEKEVEPSSPDEESNTSNSDS